MKRRYRKKGKNISQEYHVKYRDNKSYLKNKWIFTLIAICLVAFVTCVTGYVQKRHSDGSIIKVSVVRVIDGDTIVIHDGTEAITIRMIGIDAPESVSINEEENSIYGEMASDYTKQRLQSGTTVYLTFDKEKADQYGRTLAYVWMDDNLSDTDTLFQKQMLEDGYAISMRFEPNTLYADLLEASMYAAMMEKRGLWSDDTFYNENKNTILYIDSNDIYEK